MNLDQILGYINRSMSTLPDLARTYTYGNDGITQLPLRFAFFRLKSLLIKFLSSSPVAERIVILPGLRGVGKTTLLFQLYEQVIKNRFHQENCLFITCEELTGIIGTNLKETIEVYETKILGERLETVKKKVVLLIDEAHYDKSWPLVVKRLYDKSNNVFVVVSGSASLAFESTTDLVRRARFEKINPLNFYEYLMLKHHITPVKNTSKQLKEAIFLSTSAEGCFKSIANISTQLRRTFFPSISLLQAEIEKFLAVGGFPFSIQMKEEAVVFRKIIEVLKRVVEEDLFLFSNIGKDSLNKVFPILNILSSSTEKLSYESLASTLGKGNSIIHNIMQALVKAQVISTLDPCGSVDSPARKPGKKHYFTTPTIKSALLWNIGRFSKESTTLGPLLETSVYNVLTRCKELTQHIQHLCFDFQKGSADFVVTTATGYIPIECGWGNKGAQQIKNTMSQIKSKYGIVVSDRVESIEENVIFIPKEIFLLM